MHNSDRITEARGPMVEPVGDVERLPGLLHALPRRRGDTRTAPAPKPLGERLGPVEANPGQVARRVDGPPLPPVQLQAIGVPVDVEGDTLPQAAEREGECRAVELSINACHSHGRVARPVVEGAQGVQAGQCLPAGIEARPPQEAPVVEEILSARHGLHVLPEGRGRARYLLPAPHQLLGSRCEYRDVAEVLQQRPALRAPLQVGDALRAPAAQDRGAAQVVVPEEAAVPRAQVQPVDGAGRRRPPRVGRGACRRRLGHLPALQQLVSSSPGHCS
mmetsp:Transcript_30001/g.84500  ORF Transcript_30001/g.84500 Transcript_30001/m.84500 type:complete len:275 (-) Transcript_30001:35-859(-)